MIAPATSGALDHVEGAADGTPTPAPDLSIIVVSYNTRELTLTCLESIRAETRTPHEVIVVDNASSDGSAEAIAERFPEVTLLAETVNHGFGPAHDIAMAHARAPWILLLNPDTVVLDRALDRLLDFARSRPEAGIWGGRTLYGDGSLNPTSCFAQMTLWSILCRVLGLNGVFRSSSLFNPEYYGDWRRDSEREVDIVTGCLLLIRRTDWDRLGGFDPAFTTYGEEVDLCLRARAAGFRPRITPDAEIIHYGGASQPDRADKLVRLLRAKVELVERHFPSSTRRLARGLFGLWPLTRAVAYRLASWVTRRPAHRDAARTWAETWRRRDEWRHGFRKEGRA